MKKITIKKGWFYGAGSVYGWSRRNPNMHIFGVGIAMDILKTEPEILVSVAGDKYKLNCAEALEFISTYHSYKVMRNKRIGIVSKSILLPVSKSTK